MNEFLNYSLLTYNNFTLTPMSLLMILMIILIARVILWAVNRLFFKRVFKRNNVDIGRQFAVTQFFNYFVYVIASVFVLQAVGVQPTALVAGGAALLVGIGLGLQQTFNDLIAGFILLVDGTVEVGDVVMVNGLIGTVQKITIRTTHILTRDSVVQIIPNSKLVNDNVINWSHDDLPSRFHVNVGVSYTSDVQLVTSLILQAASSNPKVLTDPKPSVQFIDFGNSSLDFQLHFYSNEFLRIEVVKSEIRYKITELFRKNNIEIPFPQRDLWLRNADALFRKDKSNGVE